MKRGILSFFLNDGTPYEESADAEDTRGLTASCEWHVYEGNGFQFVYVGRTTLREYLSRANRAGLDWPLPVDLSNSDLEVRLFPHRGKRGSWGYSTT